MKINKIYNFSSVDGPGNRLVVFFQGCNFNCIYCHNPETIDYDQEGYYLTVEQLVEEILKARKFISGVTFSGGECSLQYMEIIEVANILKEKGIAVYLDTNFSLETDIYEKLSKSVEKYIVDLKAFDERIHKSLTNFGNHQVLENIKRFYDKIYEVRIVIVPGYNDNEEEIKKTLNFINSIDSNINVKLIKFRPYGVRKEFNSIAIPSDEQMENFIRIGKEIGLTNIYYK